MEQLQLLQVLLLGLLGLQRGAATPLSTQCVDESFCTFNLQDVHRQLVNLPSHVNERSIATWSYVENIDLNRVPQLIHEASCHSSHACAGLDSGYSLETVPVSVRMPVLKQNPACFHTTGYSVDYELITVACLCVISRHN